MVFVSSYIPFTWWQRAIIRQRSREPDWWSFATGIYDRIKIVFLNTSVAFRWFFSLSNICKRNWYNGIPWRLGTRHCTVFPRRPQKQNRFAFNLKNESWAPTGDEEGGKESYFSSPQFLFFSFFTCQFVSKQSCHYREWYRKEWFTSHTHNVILLQNCHIKPHVPK